MLFFFIFLNRRFCTSLIILIIVHASELFDATCRKENCHPDFVHSDNGEPMKGITL